MSPDVRKWSVNTQRAQTLLFNHLLTLPLPPRLMLEPLDWAILPFVFHFIILSTVLSPCWGGKNANVSNSNCAHMQPTHIVSWWFVHRRPAMLGPAWRVPLLSTHWVPRRPRPTDAMTDSVADQDLILAPTKDSPRPTDAMTDSVGDLNLILAPTPARWHMCSVASFLLLSMLITNSCCGLFPSHCCCCDGAQQHDSSVLSLWWFVFAVSAARNHQPCLSVDVVPRVPG
jgi:hypothetical protein